MTTIRGKSLKAVTFDIAEGYLSVNPIFLKSIDRESVKELYQELVKTQAEIRGEKFPHNDTKAIRMRNTKLQRIHSSTVIVRGFARERKILLA
jgi:pyrrolidone-carboxylate peptidase